MSRLCERPGCSEPGAAAYGMIAEDLLFWIAPLGSAPPGDPNVLCRRHADAMVVPLGWTLDDRREAQPRLFKPRPVSGPAVPPSPSRRRRAVHTPVGEQLQIDGTGEVARPPVAQLPEPDADDGGDAADGAPSTAATTDAAPWAPAFDEHDDLGGLLEVSSPLLARAFRGTERRRA